MKVKIRFVNKGGENFFGRREGSKERRIRRIVIEQVQMTRVDFVVANGSNRPSHSRASSTSDRAIIFKVILTNLEIHWEHHREAKKNYISLFNDLMLITFKFKMPLVGNIERKFDVSICKKEIEVRCAEKMECLTAWHSVGQEKELTK